jgi:dipeptidyl aminopeptidase/acylaminoacyl peptidase
MFMRGPSLIAQRFSVRKAELYGDPMVIADSVATTPFQYGFAGLFSVSESGVLAYVPSSSMLRTQLVWFDRSGKRLGTLGDPADYTNPSISPDQKMVAVAKRDPRTKVRDIWVIDLRRGASSRLTFDPGDHTNPVWSPDGKRIAFSWNRKGNRDIYVKAANGVGEEQVLVESGAEKSIEDWSEDGQYLVWGDDGTRYEWLFTFGDHKSVPLLQGRFLPDQVRFSPCRGGPPRWIAYSSPESGIKQVYVRDFRGALSAVGGKWQISTEGGSEPSWRGDGKELFYLDGSKLMAVELNADAESLRPGIPQELFEVRLPSEQRRSRYLSTSDGKHFLMNVVIAEQNNTSFRVVLNWPALLKH